ncbi:MAG: LamG domain-containing protein [Candidatus Latescibacterota bacterium]|jgi:hypothetical protein
MRTWRLTLCLLCVVTACDQENGISSTSGLVIARVSGNQQQGRPGTSLASPLVVMVTYRTGQPVANQRVDFAVTQGDARLVVESVLSDARGLASTRLVLGSTEGPVEVQASVFGSDSVVTFGLTVTASAGGSPDDTTTTGGTMGQEGLIYYYPLNGDADDEGGSGNDGSVHGATPTEDRFGIANSAYTFDGQDDYIVSARPVGIAANAPRSVTAWVRILRFRDDTSVVFWGDLSTTGAACGAIWFSEPGQRLRFRGHYQDVDSPSTDRLQTGVWQHLAFTFDGTTGKLFVDGQEVGTASLTLRTTDTELSLGFGLYEEANDPLNRHFNGDLDEVRIYDRALSATEVQALSDDRPSTGSESRRPTAR